MRILAIETSCDETAAAVVEDGVRIRTNTVATSKEMHEKYGGIVPEVAARMQLAYIIPVLTEALRPLSPQNNNREIIERYIDAIAVTVGPGLIGSLLVGVETAKTLSFVTGKPLIPVNHVLAHMYANLLNTNQQDENSIATKQKKPHIQFPAISLVVSGGHTELYLMKHETDLTWLGGTLDDAAGECFDKTARLLGFGHGGGVAIQEAAKLSVGHKSQFTGRLPRPMLGKHNVYNFSFSGLKTAILREVTALKNQKMLDQRTISQLSQEVQETITDVLVKKTLMSADAFGAKSILLSGGVAANVRLREKFASSLDMLGSSAPRLFVPPVALCTDNAVYIASYAYFFNRKKDWKSITAYPDLSVEVSS